MATPYIATGDLAQFLGVADASLDLALADLAVSAAMQKVRNHLAQEITYHAGDVTYLDGNGRTKIRLRERPVHSVSLVEEGSGDEFTTLASDAYLLRDDILIRWDGSVWLAGDANLRVTYTHGWHVADFDSDVSDSDFNVGLNSLPPDITLATLHLAKRIYENSGANAESSGDVKQETIGSYSYTLSSEAEKAGKVTLSEAEMILLESYRRTGAG